jgi:uncharacterized membrane protein YuzA (DUF378 family)
VIEPFARLVMWVSAMARRLQHGRTHTYILYLIIGLAAVAVMAMVWDQ